MIGELCRRARQAGLVCIDFEGHEPLAVHEDGRQGSAERLAGVWAATLRRALLAESDGVDHEKAVCSAAKRVAAIMGRPSTEWDRLGLQEAHRDLVNALAPLEAHGVIPVSESWVGAVLV